MIEFCFVFCFFAFCIKYIRQYKITDIYLKIKLKLNQISKTYGTVFVIVQHICSPLNTHTRKRTRTHRQHWIANTNLDTDSTKLFNKRKFSSFFRVHLSFSLALITPLSLYPSSILSRVVNLNYLVDFAPSLSF